MPKEVGRLIVGIPLRLKLEHSIDRCILHHDGEYLDILFKYFPLILLLWFVTLLMAKVWC